MTHLAERLLSMMQPGQTSGLSRDRLLLDMPHRSPDRDFDPEMLYVECHVCGKPILWESGRTTELLEDAGVDLRGLDEHCLILAEGCPVCRPGEPEGFMLSIVRIAGLTPEEAELMGQPAGNS